MSATKCLWKKTDTIGCAIEGCLVPIALPITSVLLDNLFEQMIRAFELVFWKTKEKAHSTKTMDLPCYIFKHLMGYQIRRGGVRTHDPFLIGGYRFKFLHSSILSHSFAIYYNWKLKFCKTFFNFFLLIKN